MELESTADPTPLQRIARRVGEQLHARGILAPYWLIETVVSEHLTDADPLTMLEIEHLDAATSEEVAAAIADSVTAEVIADVSMPESTGNPAVLNLEETGRLITTLGVATHCALINASSLQPVLAAVLGRVASCTMTIGAAAQDAHRGGDAVLLLPPETLELARQALSGTLTELLAGRWTVVGDDRARTAVLVLLQDGLSRLGTT